MKAVIRLLVCVFLQAPFVSHAAAPQTSNSGQTVIRSVPRGKIDKYLADRDFVYDRNYSTTTSIWDKIGMWIERHLFRSLLKNHSLTVWYLILYAIAIAAIVLIIYYFARSDKVGLFARKSKEVPLGIDEITENIHQVDFDKIIGDAVAARQYRVAIRYLYLKSLKDLSVKGFITWKSDKTNRDYINEMRPSVFGKLFRDITYLFDYAWYGNIEINEISFNRMKDTFRQFDQQLYSSN